MRTRGSRALAGRRRKAPDTLSRRDAPEWPCGLFAAGSVGHTALLEALQCPNVHNSQSPKWKSHRSRITSQSENEKDPYTK